MHKQNYQWAWLWCMALAFRGMAASVLAAPPVDGAKTYSEQEAGILLRSELKEFEVYVESSMRGAYALLRNRKTPKADLRVFEVWQNAQRDQMRQALKAPDAITALADAWAVSDGLTLSLEEGKDKLPPSVRDVARDMVMRRQNRLIHIASRYLPADAVAALSGGIRSYSEGQSAESAESTNAEKSTWSKPLFSVWAKGQSTVGSVLQLPLAPGRALMGIADSGKALSGMRDTAAEAVMVAGEMPERIRIEFEHALSNVVERRVEIMEILNTVNSVSTNLRSFAEAGQATAGEAKESLAMVRDLAPHAEAMAASIERTAQTLAELVASMEVRAQTHEQNVTSNRVFDVREYEAAADAISDAARGIEAAMLSIQALFERSASGEKEPGARTFDIREYTAAADSIAHSALEIRGILIALNDVSTDGAFSKQIAELRKQATVSADHAELLARQFVDHLVSQILVAVGLILLMLLVYGRLKRRGPTPS